MKLSAILYLFVAVLIFTTACSDEKGPECKDRIYLYSYDRQGNDVLHTIPSGTMYAVKAGVVLQRKEALSPLPRYYHLEEEPGKFDLGFLSTVNSVTHTVLDPQMQLSEGSVKVNPTGGMSQFYTQEPVYYPSDEVFLGVIKNYKHMMPDDIDFQSIDSMNLRRMVGAIKVHVINPSYASPNAKGYMEIKGVSIGLQNDTTIIQRPIIVAADSVMNKEKNELYVSAMCFPSVAPITVSFKLTDAVSGNTIDKVSKTLLESLTPNKCIIIEYEYTSGGLVEFDLIVRDFDTVIDGVQSDAYTK